MKELILTRAQIKFPSEYQLTIQFKPELRVSRKNPIIIFGPNGSGKTILLELLSGIFPTRIPNTGVVYKMDVEGGENLRNLRLGFLPANPSLFFMHATVFEEFMSSRKRGGNEDAFSWYNWEQIWKRYAGHHPLTLSVGMQRMLIMDLLITRNTDVFYLDEPLSSLDGREQISFYHKVRMLMDRSKVIVITTSNELVPVLFGARARVFHAEVTEKRGGKETIFTEVRVEDNPFTSFVSKIVGNSSLGDMGELAGGTWDA